MKKLMILIISVILFTLTSSATYAESNREHTITLKIKYVSYSEYDKSYYAITESDASGHKWVVFITQKQYNEASYNWLNKYFKTLNVEIVYEGDIDDIEVELASTKFVKASSN